MSPEVTGVFHEPRRSITRVVVEPKGGLTPAAKGRAGL